MAFWNRTPLAWKNLTSSPKKLLLVAGGVGFAVVLMFMQVGFRNALFDSPVQLVRMLDADLIIVSKARYNLPSEQRFDRSLVDRAATVQGVTDALPIYIERSIVELRVIGNPSRGIRVVGIPLRGHVFVDGELDAKRRLLADGRSALLDKNTKRPYGFTRESVEKLREQDVELSRKEIHMVDWVDVGTDFVHDGTLFVSDNAISDYFAFRGGGDPLSIVDLALIQIEKDADPKVVQRHLSQLAPESVDVLTRAEIIEREIQFWGTATPIGVIFTVGTIMGLVVGTIICYQILFTDISEHIAEFATLKAMGYSPGYFFRLVLNQAFFLTILGFLPGFLVTLGLFSILGEVTGLVMLFTPSRIAFVFLLTLGMCVVSGILAVRKLWSADPASLF
jgi:putative ABC transport system permease protein